MIERWLGQNVSWANLDRHRSRWEKPPVAPSMDASLAEGRRLKLVARRMMIELESGSVRLGLQLIEMPSRSAMPSSGSNCMVTDRSGRLIRAFIHGCARAGKG